MGWAQTFNACMALVCVLCDYTIAAPGQRFRRQLRQNSYSIPFYNPFPGRSASNIGPIFPFHPNTNLGLEVQPALIRNFDGYLNVPIPTWGLFDLKGGVRTGTSPLRVQTGVVAGPNQNAGLTPEAFAALNNDPSFIAAREASPEIPVAVLPNDYTPLRCKPPFCNPYQSTIGLGVLVDPFFQKVFDGGIDLPIPVAEDGVGVRFPLSGGVRSGIEPITINYGQSGGPVDPFKKIEKHRLESLRQRQEEEGALQAARLAAGSGFPNLPPGPTGPRFRPGSGDPFAGWPGNSQQVRSADAKENLPTLPPRNSTAPQDPFASLPDVPSDRRATQQRDQPLSVGAGSSDSHATRQRDQPIGDGSQIRRFSHLVAKTTH